MEISEHFDIREFIPPEIWSKFGTQSRWFVRPEIVNFAEFVRNHFGKSVTINNWHTGGSFHYRGLRTPECTEGAANSQHRYMNAIDLNVSGMTSDEVYDHILANEKLFMEAGLTTLEDKAMTKGWTHCDFRNTGLDKILIVKP